MKHKLRPFHILLAAAAVLLPLGIYVASHATMSLALTCLGIGLLDIKRVTRGPGSWALDNTLTLSAGAYFGAAFAILLT